MKRIIGFIVLIFTVILTGTFAVYNHHDVIFYFPGGQVIHSLVLFLALALLCGVLMGVSASLLVILKVRTELRRLRKQVRVKEQEIENLRSIPFKEQN